MTLYRSGYQVTADRLRTHLVKDDDLLDESERTQFEDVIWMLQCMETARLLRVSLFDAAERTIRWT